MNADLDRIVSWGAVAVITLVEAHELDELKIQNLGRDVQRRRMEWFHWPIKDYGVPDAEFEASWPARSAKGTASEQAQRDELVRGVDGLP